MSAPRQPDSGASRRNRRVALMASGLVAGMLGLSYASVPLYRLFCQVTGYGGTTQRVNQYSDRVLDRKITVRFDSNVSGGLPWTFQPVARDFAFIVDRAVAPADIVRAAQGADKALITNVDVFDLYEGKGIEPGKKSLAISVTIQPIEKTLTDAEIEAIAGKIVEEVKKKTGASLRG